MRTLTDVGARMILARLREAGYTGYLVGGAVRDLLLLRTVEDYDFATSASSAELLALFADARLIGGACGTVDVSIGGAHYQVTPYRREGVYDDHRHPRDVCAAKTMEEDLARRDFTINAMAYDGETLLDPFGGGADLEAKQLRCVGDAAVRFGEDALRVLRLARFSAVLGFSVEEKTAAAAWAAAPSVGLLPAARVRTELQKLLLSPHPDALKVLLDAEGLAAFSLGHTKRDFSLDALPCNMLLRWWGVMQLCDAQRLHVVQSLEF
ncbi:MAG: CCA tRNA nucleotidyltransferase [Pygmaiobacter sp.]